MSWALHGLRWSYCAFIAWSSLQTLLGTQAELHSPSGHAVHALFLSCLELLAIAAFLVDRLAIYACIVLTAVFAIAAMLAALEGQIPLRFVYFAATAISIASTLRDAAERRAAPGPKGRQPLRRGPSPEL